MRYSFVIATIGRENELKSLLESIIIQTCEDYEIIIVDQNHHSRIKNLCKKNERINYIHSTKKGLSLARNKGIQQAKGEYIIFPDDDAILSNKFLENANYIIHKFPDIYVFSGLVLTIGSQEPFSQYMDIVSEELNYGNYNKFVSTAMIIHKSVFQQLGGFDENMGVGAKWGGSEETEFLLRALKADYKAYYTPFLCVYHPKADFSQMTWKQAIYKGYSYGLGRGALFRKLIGSFGTCWILWQWLLSLLKSVGGMIISLFKRQRKNLVRHLGALIGRIVGFVMAKTYYL